MSPNPIIPKPMRPATSPPTLRPLAEAKAVFRDGEGKDDKDVWELEPDEAMLYLVSNFLQESLLKRLRAYVKIREILQRDAHAQQIATLRAEQPKAGEMHPVDDAFYRHTVAQRDNAWREIELLTARATTAERERERLVERAEYWERQFETLRADLAWSPSEQAAEIQRLLGTLSDAAVTLAGLREDRDRLQRELDAVTATLDREREMDTVAINEAIAGTLDRVNEIIQDLCKASGFNTLSATRFTVRLSALRPKATL